MNKKTKIITTSILLYIILASVCCQPVAIISSTILNGIGIEAEIGTASVEGKPYTHAFIFVNNTPYEPRFLGLYLKDDIDYHNPCAVYSTEEYLIRKEGLMDLSVIPLFINSNIDAIVNYIYN